MHTFFFAYVVKFMHPLLSNLEIIRTRNFHELTNLCKYTGNLRLGHRIKRKFTNKKQKQIKCFIII